MKKIISAHECASLIKSGNSLLVSGFLGVGAPQNIIDELLKLGTNNLHLISIATDFPSAGVGKLVANNQVKSIQTSHIGTNPITQEKFNKGEVVVEFVPQGTLIERIRAFGAGLGGILTPTGVSTDVEKGKTVHEIDGKRYLLEKPIGADFALVRAHKADKFGNLIYKKTARNANPVMAMSGKTVIAEVDEIVEPGKLDPESIVTPGLFVDYLVVHKE